jgi:hypothetical protein
MSKPSEFKTQKVDSSRPRLVSRRVNLIISVSSSGVPVSSLISILPLLFTSEKANRTLPKEVSSSDAGGG